jgi:hypothetical protein
MLLCVCLVLSYVLSCLVDAIPFALGAGELDSEANRNAVKFIEKAQVVMLWVFATA